MERRRVAGISPHLASPSERQSIALRPPYTRPGSVQHRRSAAKPDSKRWRGGSEHDRRALLQESPSGFVSCISLLGGAAFHARATHVSTYYRPVNGSVLRPY